METKICSKCGIENQQNSLLFVIRHEGLDVQSVNSVLALDRKLDITRRKIYLIS